MRVMGALDRRGGGVAGQHVVRPPAGQHHQVSLLTSSGEPPVGEGVPAAVRVDVGDAGLRGAGVQHVAGAVGVIGPRWPRRSKGDRAYGCSARTRR